MEKLRHGGVTRSTQGPRGKELLPGSISPRGTHAAAPQGPPGFPSPCFRLCGQLSPPKSHITPFHRPSCMLLPQPAVQGEAPSGFFNMCISK